MTRQATKGSSSTRQKNELQAISLQFDQLDPEANFERAQLELRRANLHLAADERQEGLDALRSSWRIHPRSETFFTLESRLESLGEAEELQALYLDGTRRALSLSLRTSCLLRVTETLGQDDTNSQRALEEALEEPDTLGFIRWQPQTARDLADRLEQLGQSSSASIILRSLVAEVRDEESFADVMKLAQREEARGDEEAAYEAYRAALRLHPTADEALAPAREYLLERGRYEALAELLALSAGAALSSKRAASLWRELARLAEDQLTDTARAIQAWQRAWGLAHTGEEATHLKRLYATDEQWPRYLELLEHEALRCSQIQRKVQIYREMATCQLEVLEDNQAALGSYARLLQLAPQDRDALASTVAILQRNLAQEEGRPSFHDHLHIRRAMERFISHCERSEQRDAMLRQLIELELGADNTDKLISHLRKLDPRNETNEHFVARLWKEKLEEGPEHLAGLMSEVALVILDFRNQQPREKQKLPIGLELLRECNEHDRGDVANLLLHHLALLAPEDEELSAQLRKQSSATPRGEEARREELIQKAEAAHESDPALAARLWISAAQIAAREDPKCEQVRRSLTEARRSCTQGARREIRLLESVLDELTLHEDLAAFLTQQLRWGPPAMEQARLRTKLARLYRGPLDQSHEAIEQLEALLELSPDDPEILRELIEVHRELEQYGPLVSWLATFLEQSSEDKRAKTLEELGAVYAEKLTDERMAFHYYGQLLLLRPDHEVALDFVRGRGEEGNDARRRVASLLAQAAESSANDNRRNELLEETARLAEEQLGDRDLAITQWRRITSLCPSNVKARKELKRLLGAVGRWGELEALLLSACSRTEAAEEKALIYLELARLSRVQLGDLETAGNHLRAAHQLAPRDAQVLAEMAIVYEALEQWRRLATVLERHAELELDERARINLLHKAAEVLILRLRQQEEALAVCRRIREFAPGDPRSAALMGDIYAGRDQWKNLASLWREQLGHENIPAKLIPLHLQLGKVLLKRLGEQEKAAEQFEAVLDLAPEQDEVLPLLRDIYSKSQRWDRLVKLVERRAMANSVAPALRADAFFEVGELHRLKLEDEVEARHAYEQALHLTSGHREAMAALRKLASDKKEWREVLSLARHELETLTHHPDKARLLVEIASILEHKLQRPGAATEALREALRLDEQNSEAGARLGLLAFHEGRWDEAVELLTQLDEGSLQVANLHEHLFRLGWAHEKLGHEDEAFSCYVKSFSSEPLYLPTLDRLLDLCFERRQWDNTQRIAEAIISSYGGDKSPRELADVFVRLGLCELHQAQQRAALRRLQAIALPKRTQPLASNEAWEEAAKSWAATPVEPLLLRDVKFKVVTRVIKAMDHALSLIPHHADALQILAALTMSRGDWDRSLRYLERAAQSEDLSPKHRARLQIAAGDVAWSQLLSRRRGESCYRRALELAPTLALARQRLASITGNTINLPSGPATSELELADMELDEHPTQELLQLEKKRR